MSSAVQNQIQIISIFAKESKMLKEEEYEYVECDFTIIILPFTHDNFSSMRARIVFPQWYPITSFPNINILLYSKYCRFGDENSILLSIPIWNRKQYSTNLFSITFLNKFSKNVSLGSSCSKESRKASDDEITTFWKCH